MQVDSFSIPTSLPITASGGKSATGAAGGTSPDVPVAGQGAEHQNTSEHSAKLEKVISSIQDAFKSVDISLHFSKDEDTGSIVIKLIDQTTGEAVQQIPSETSLHLAAALGKLQGQIFDRKA